MWYTLFGSLFTGGGRGGGTGQDEDDVNAGAEAEAEAEAASRAARDMLLSLPGINMQNYRAVMNRVENIAELSKMNVAQLSPLIGPVNAKKLHIFFTQRMYW